MFLSALVYQHLSGCKQKILSLSTLRKTLSVPLRMAASPQNCKMDMQVILSDKFSSSITQEKLLEQVQVTGIIQTHESETSVLQKCHRQLQKETRLFSSVIQQWCQCYWTYKWRPNSASASSFNSFAVTGEVPRKSTGRSEGSSDSSIWRTARSCSLACTLPLLDVKFTVYNKENGSEICLLGMRY